MTFKSILESNGFTENGLCQPCGGTAMKYTKVKNNRVAEVKVKIEPNTYNPTTKEYIAKGTCTIHFGIVTKVHNIEHLQTTLNDLGLGTVA